MIRVEAVWLCTEPMDMRAGTDTTLTRVVQVFGSARPHHAYVFTNKRSTRLKVLVHDGIGIWLAARRLHEGRFIWPGGGLGAPSPWTCVRAPTRRWREWSSSSAQHARTTPTSSPTSDRHGCRC